MSGEEAGFRQGAGDSGARTSWFDKLTMRSSRDLQQLAVSFSNHEGVAAPSTASRRSPSPVRFATGEDPRLRAQSKRLLTLCSLAVRAMASPIRGAMERRRMFLAALTRSVGAIESVITSSLSLLAATRVAASPERTPWVI